MEQVMQNLRSWLEKTSHQLIRLWDRLSDKLEDWVHSIQSMFAPTLPQLQKALDPLLEQSSTGFPAAMIRANLITAGSPDAMLSYDELKQKYANEQISPQDLVKRFVDNEADAYLTSHLVALETAIKNPGKKIDLGSGSPTTLKVGVEDANAVVRRRVNQHFYGKDNHGVADSLYNLILASPKVTLHEHYRGCAPMAMVRSKFIQQGHRKAYKCNDTLENFMRVERLYTHDGLPKAIHADLNSYRAKYDEVAVSIDSDETAYMGAYMYTLRAGLENVRYFEYRLNPISSIVKDPVRFVRSIQQGLDDAAAFLKDTTGQRIDSNLVISADRQPKDGAKLRNIPGKPYDSRVDMAMKIMDVAFEARRQGLRVTGFDIQGDEANYAITDFKPVADKLKAYNALMVATGRQDMRIGATIHAGETPVSGLISHPDRPLSGHESVRKSIELFWDKNTPMRIGHGVRVQYDPKLIQECLKKNIGFEQCPKSNVQTRAVGYYHDMPSLFLSRDYGLKVSISCDNRTVSKTNACNELVKMARHLNVKHDDRKLFQMNGIDTAFIFDENQRQGIREDMMQRYAQIEQTPEFADIIQQEKDPERFQQLIENKLSLAA